MALAVAKKLGLATPLFGLSVMPLLLATFPSGDKWLLHTNPKHLHTTQGSTGKKWVEHWNRLKNKLCIPQNSYSYRGFPDNTKSLSTLQSNTVLK